MNVQLQAPSARPEAVILPPVAERRVVPVPGSHFPIGAGEPVIVVFPHAGGSPRQYARWCWAGAVEMERFKVSRAPAILGVTYPLRDHRFSAQRLPDVQSLAADVLPEIVNLLLGRPAVPVILAGHSLGAVVAVEVARALQESHPDVSLPTLVISGQVSPEYAGGGCFHLGSDQEIIAELARMDPATAQVLAYPELAAIHLPAIREDYRLIETYRSTDSVAGPVPCPPLNAHIVVVRGAKDTELRDASLAGWGRWGRTVIGPITVPGDHMHHLAHPELAYICHRVARSQNYNTVGEIN